MRIPLAVLLAMMIACAPSSADPDRAIGGPFVSGVFEVRAERGGEVAMIHREGALRLRVAAFGRDSRAAAPGPARAVSHAGDTLTVTRDRFVEWYRRTSEGIEQGFEILERPEGTSELTFVIACDRELAVDATGSRASIRLGPSRVVRVEGLAARDRDGHALRTWMSHEAGALVFHVDDANAVYPLTIDPRYIEGEQQLAAPDGRTGAQFGSAVSVSGSYAAVGAPAALVTTTGNDGAVYLYRRDADAWTFEAKLHASDAGKTMAFGSSIALEGDTLAVGASGAIYIFARTPSGWSEVQRIPGTGLFGTYLALAGDTLLASRDVGGAAVVDVYERTGAGWSATGSLAKPTDAPPGFGTALAISGTTAAIGAAAVSYGAEAGSAFLYERGSSGWALAATLVPESSEPEFGTAVALHGDTLLVASPAFSPSAYLYRRDAIGWQREARMLRPSTDSGGFARHVALSDDLAIIGSVNSSRRGTGYAYLREGSTWSLWQTLHAKVDSGDDFTSAMAIDGEVVLIGADNGGDIRPSSGAAWAFSIPTVKANGGACSSAVGCTSGFCVEGVCCESECNAPCTSCRAEKTGVAEGTCAPSARAVDETCPVECTADRRGIRRIDGSTIACAPYACAAGSCLHACASVADCSEGTCNADGVCAPPSVPDAPTSSSCQAFAGRSGVAPAIFFLALIALRRRTAR